MSISSSAVLAKLNISVWTANKLDHGATAQVIAVNGAADKAAQVRKNLMAGTRARKDIADFAAECRLWHNQWTLAWDDRGSRLLPTSLFLDYKAQANKRRDKFNAMVNGFLHNYAAHVQTSANYLGTLFDASDYPTEDQVRQKFGFHLVFTPVPESGHFILDIPQQELEETKASCELEIQQRTTDAMRGAWDRLYKMLSTMRDKLEETEDSKKRWHDSFVTNAQELCQMLTHLNVTGDAELEKARKGLESAMQGADIDCIKGSEAVRENLKVKVDSILSQFEW